jgi:hypothetical protein
MLARRFVRTKVSPAGLGVLAYVVVHRSLTTLIWGSTTSYNRLETLKLRGLSSDVWHVSNTSGSQAPGPRACASDCLQ